MRIFKLVLNFGNLDFDKTYITWKHQDYKLQKVCFMEDGYYDVWSFHGEYVNEFRNR